MKLQFVPRRIAISVEEVSNKKIESTRLTDDKGVHLGFRLGMTETWLLADGWYYRDISVPQICDRPGEDGGVPEIDDDATLDDLLNGINDAVCEHGMPVFDLTKVVNNGLSLFYSAKAKPKLPSARIDPSTIMDVWIEHATDEDRAAYAKLPKDAPAIRTKFLRDWYAKR